jgi:translocation and assembly module TamB
MTDETTPAPARKPVATRIALWIAGALATLLVLLVAILLGLDTTPGHRFLADQIGKYTTQSGISIHPGRIEGSIYSRMTILDLDVRDPQGAFLTVPRLDIDWHPFAYAHKLIDVRSALADQATLLRSPRLKPTPPPPPNQPLLPDIDLALGQLRVGRLTIEPAVDGKRHVLGIAGSAALAQGRAQIDATVQAVAGPGLAGGDHFRLRLDAVPAENRLLVDLKLDAPAGGMVDSYAHLGKSLALTLGGHGDWANWHGALTATAGGSVLADMALTGANGHFQVNGRALPSAILAEGAATRLTAPELDLAGSVVLGQRRADVNLAAHSAAFAVSAQGLIDLATNSLGGFHVTGRLSNPGAITPEVSGRDVRLDAVLDGPMATPSIDYRLSAAAFGFKTMAIEGLQAHGKATIDAMHILVPVNATASRVAGLDAAAGGLLTNLSANGTVAYSGGKLLTDNLALKSDRLNVTVIAIADLARGQYTGAIKGRINDYHVQGLGRIALEADAHLVPARNGGFGIAGWVRAQTRQIDNASVASFLGGNALLSADIGYSADSVASLSNLRVTAPALHIDHGDGRYMPDGRILFRTAGNSGQYGPFAIDAAGTVARPVVHLHADRPNVGVQLANIDARLTGNGSGEYDVTASGGSPYGPFAGNIAITTAKGPLQIGIKSAQFAGVHFAGALTQTAQGPFAGTVTAQGSGLDGRIQLAAAGKVQRAEVTATANAAKVPGPGAITIGGGTIHAVALLTPGAPEITGSARLTDIRQGQLIVASAQARVDYRQGHGTVALVTSGHDSVPFNLAAQAAIAPDRIVFNAKGSANTIAFNLAAPAVLTKAGSDWQLGQTTILLPHGQVVLTGHYGARSQVHATIANLDLSIIQAVAPQLLLGGKATGTVDIALPGGNALPVAQIRLDVAGFTRTGAMTVSDPLDLAFQVTSGGDSANLAALIRQRGAIVGRAQVRLNAGGTGGAWTDRLMHAGLSGGIRYTGPSELLWTLTGIAGQEVSGPVALAADFSGRADQPALNGVIRANQLRYENDAYGTVINGIAIDGRFTQSQFVLNSMTGKAGSGTLSAQGSVSLDAGAGYPISLSVRLANARLAKSDALGASVSGTIAVTNSKAAGGLIQGDIALGEIRYQIIRQGAAEVPELTGVHRKGQPVQAASATDQGPAPSQWKLAMHVHAPGRIFVSGMGLEAEWSTDMKITGTAGAPSVVGELDVVRGTYSFAGKDLDLDNTSKVTFDGSALTNPQLAITASTTVNSVTATIAITGRAQQPQIAFTSTPALPQDEVLSRLLFGTDVTSLSPIEAVQLAAALNSLRGSGGGFSPLGKIRSVAGFDRLRVVGANAETGQGTSLAAGKYLARNVYVEIVTDARGFTATQLEVALSKAFSVLSSTGTFGGSNAGIRYRRDH